MKKCLVVLLICFGLFSCSDSDSNFPEPNLIPFEKQEVLSSYDLRLIESTGRTINLYANQNKVVFIHYWNTTDKDVSADIKIMQKLYDDYKLKIEFYFITDDTQPNIRKYIKDNNLLFPNYYMGSTPLRPLVFGKLVKSYLISKTGRIVMNQEGVADWNSETVRKTIDDLLKQ
jgi:thiol-disulfide isomerase/thioredoxin